MYFSSRHSGGVRWTVAAVWTLLLAVLPLFYRGGELWWLPVASCLAALGTFLWMSCCALYGHRCHRGQLPMPIPRWSAGYLLFLLPFAIGVLQICRLGKSLTATLSSHAAECWNRIPGEFHSLSLYPTGTRLRMWLLLACLAIFFMSRNFCRHRRYVYWVLGIVAFSALLDAFVGFWQLLSPGTAARCPFTALETETTHGAVRGIFLNRNHFGFHMAMGISAVAGILMMLSTEELPPPNNVVGMHLRARRSIQNAFLVVVLFCLYAADLVSLSRGGFLAANISLLLLGCLWFFGKHHRRKGMGGEHSSHRRNTLAMAFIFVMAVVFALPFVLERLSDRFKGLLEEDGITGDTRVQVWHSSLNLTKKYWLTGVGLGAYGDAIQASAKPGLDQGRIEHAHNDYLELLAETGVPLSLALLALLAWSTIPAVRRIPHCPDYAMRYGAWAAGAALVGAAVHEFFDYSLQAYPNALIASAFLGLILAVGNDDEEELHHLHSHRRRGIILGGISLLVCVISAGFFWGEWRHHRLWQSQNPGYHPRGQSMVAPSMRLQLGVRAWMARPWDPAVAARYARELLEAGNRETENLDARLDMWERAYDLECEALKGRPAYYPGWQNRGVTAFSLGDRKGALQDLEVAVLLAPTLTQPRLLAASYYDMAGMGIHNDCYRKRALALRQSVLQDRQELSSGLLPQLLPPDLPLAEFLESCTPGKELSLDILGLLMKQHRFGEADGYLATLVPEDYAGDPKEMLRLAEMRLTLAALEENTGNAEKIADANRKYIAAMRASKEATPLLYSAGNLRSVEAVIRSLETVPAGALPEQRLQVARELLNLAEPASAVEVLLPLLYPGMPFPAAEGTPSPVLSSALALLEGISADIDTPAGFRLAVLRAIVQRNRTELLGLSRHYDEAAESSAGNPGIPLNPLAWLQAHLMELYLGYFAEEAGEPQEALEHYRKVLKNHPDNGFTLARMAALAPEELSPDQMKMAVLAQAPPRAYLASAAQVLAIQFQPGELQSAHETLEVAVYLRVQDGTTTPLQLGIRLATSQGNFATVPLVSDNGLPICNLLWTTGDILRLQASIPTCLAKAIGANKLPQGDCLLSLEVVKMPGESLAPKTMVVLPVKPSH